MSNTTIEEYILRAAPLGASGLMVQISDLQAYKKEIDDLKHQVNFLYCPIDADDYIRLSNAYHESREEYKKHTEHIQRLLRGMKRLTKENEKLKKEIVEKDKAMRRLRWAAPGWAVAELDKGEAEGYLARAGVRDDYTDEEWDVLGAAPIKEGEPQIIDYYHN
tara:strand:+ start:235 stop:723 length:489 start_codon:yes stop_codon:yes gene_type:complete